MANRIHEVASVVFADPVFVAELTTRGTGVLLETLARHVQASRRSDELWLLIVGLTASFPETEVVLRTRRALAAAAPEGALLALLQANAYGDGRLRALEYDMQIVTDFSVVDVDFCARFTHNTGIQRVVRETMTRWNGVHPMLLTCWNSGDNGYRNLTDLERRRVVDWDVVKTENHDDEPDGHPLPDDFHPRLIVPFRTTLILPEVAHEGLARKLSAIARFSGNRVAMIGYDTIPVASAADIHSHESEKFSKYLTIVKYATRIAAISASAAEEFQGFTDAVAAQGLTGPTVTSVSLAVQSPAPGSRKSPVHLPASDEKMILVVGNQEPRKNLLAVLFACEMLWNEGLRFRLRMIGGAREDYKILVDAEVERLGEAGRHVEVRRGVGDAVLIDSFQSAYFTIFPSTHEGYGLPVAESLSMGVPSITSNFGSTLQIAEGGGCLTVDPRDDDAIIDAMRSLLLDENLRERLALEARQRHPRSWDDYAAELWNELVEPLGEN